MIGYVFEVQNTENGKKCIGKYLSTCFDKKYLGDNPKLLDDVKTFGADKFTVKMLRAAETVKDCETAYDAFVAEVLTDSNYYNCESEAEKPKRRKKKVVEE